MLLGMSCSKFFNLKFVSIIVLIFCKSALIILGYSHGYFILSFSDDFSFLSVCYNILYLLRNISSGFSTRKFPFAIRTVT